MKLSFNFIKMIGWTILISSFATAQTENAPANTESKTTKLHEPFPCTVSFFAIGSAKPPSFTSPENYLKAYRGRDIQMDETCELMIKTGDKAPVMLPILENEKPPGPLKVHADPRNKTYLSFSLILGGTSMRIPASRGTALEVYSQTMEAFEDGQLVTIQSEKIRPLIIPEDSAHMLFIFINGKKSYKWDKYKILSFDISPAKCPAGSVLFINHSSKDVIFSTVTAAADKKILVKSDAGTIFTPDSKLNTTRYKYALATSQNMTISSVIARSNPDNITLIYLLDEITPSSSAGVCAKAIRVKSTPLTVDEIIKLRASAYKEAEKN